MDDPQNLSSTQDLQSSGEDSQKSFSLAPPTKIGRYTILGLLGKGGFGEVFQGFDDDLNRPVAIKVPRPERVSYPEDIEAYLNEARMVASLDHPHIVPVYDLGRTDDGMCFVVSKFIEGSDLAKRIKENRLDFHESVALVATVVEALHFAHTRGLVHRDIKPGNILIDASGIAFLADFGLALKEEDFGTGARNAGTPSYMSPEQARCEGHRVDGRSDIFSLGVVFYELLTGRRPFIAKATDKDEARKEVMDLIATTEARPPRMVDDKIPKELERICLKALSKRATERYNTALDMAEDLREFLKTTGATVLPAAPAVPISTPPGSTLESPSHPITSRQSDSDQRPIRIVPKGLRSFDQHDADFFLELLPGPRDRDGLPDSIRFWKRKIEQIDPDLTFRVGLIYGPSGCGKSSMVRAGLLPRLAKHVLAVYVEATAEDTEARLLKGLRKACPELSPGSGLVDSLANLRRGRFLPPERKVLLVLDQSEQWLHAKRGEENSELVAALRHCDGEHVQAVVLVRDDFWMAATRFMRGLEIRLLEGDNSAAVDLFDLDHARKVLVAFGQAFGRLPERESDASKDQKDFLKESVNGLAEEGKVISVRLALFAEMMKGKPWTPVTLKEVGGTKGVGVTFLEETFSASTAPPEHRLHQKAAQAVLKALLPETGTDIKGQMRSRQELLEASGYVNRHRDFDDLIHILDPELRLITPTDPEGSSSEGQQTTPSGQCYQLTHDYLVHSLRDWLTRKQRETRRGRAELRLVERSASWNAKPENRYLPSTLEWANIRLLTKKKEWTAPQLKMMKRAGRVHVVRASTRATLMILPLALATLFGVLWVEWVIRPALDKEGLNTVLVSPLTGVPRTFDSLIGYRGKSVEPLLRQAYSEAKKSGDSRKQLNAAVALSRLLPLDDQYIPYLKDRLLTAEAQNISVLRMALASRKDAIVPDFWYKLEKPTPEDRSKALQAASALALYDPATPRWEKVRTDVVNRLVAENAYVVAHWIDALRPVREQMRDPLVAVFHDEKRAESERTLAANALAEYLSDQPRDLAELLMDATEKQFAALYPSAERRSAQTTSLLEVELAKKPPSKKGAKPTDVDNKVWDKFYKRQANAGVALIRMRQTEKSWSLLKHSPDPSLRSYLVHRLGPLGVEPGLLIAKLDHEVEVSIRRALILSLGEYGEGRLSTIERDVCVKKLLDLYRIDPDPGIHGAAEWLLHQWRNDSQIQEIDKELGKLPLPRLRMDQGESSSMGNNRGWYINSQGQTMVIISDPVKLEMGEVRTQHREQIGRSFAIATKEVTVEQFESFYKDNPTLRSEYNESLCPSLQCPQITVSWYQAAAYCNWLSKKEGIPREEWCYLPNVAGRYETDMRLASEHLCLSGHRLPTEAEWDYSCRVGTTTNYSYGDPEDLLVKYGWAQRTANGRTWPVGSLKPNDLGICDMHGNAWEWCQDIDMEYSIFAAGKPGKGTDPGTAVRDRDKRSLRGGAFLPDPGYMRSDSRFRHEPNFAYTLDGFRPARTIR